MLDAIQLRAHFRQDTRDFPAANQNVVRPFDFRVQAGFGLNRAPQSCRGSDGESRGFLRTQIRSQQNGKPKPFSRRRHPRAPEPAPALRLRFRKNNGALLHPVARQPFNHVVGRSRLLEHVDVAPDDFRFAEAREQIVRVQRVGRAYEAIAEVRAGLDVVAELAQFLDMSPDRRAGDAQLLGDFRARHPVGIRAQRCKNLGVGGHEMENSQHSTSNSQHPILKARRPASIRCSMLNVRCSGFLFIAQNPGQCPRRARNALAHRWK